MTTITNAGQSNPAQIMRQQFAAQQQFALATGILASYANPLGAGLFASAQLASLWAVSAFAGGRPEPEAQFTATTGGDGKASIDLGDGYTLKLNENSSEATITNANTGETTRIWGDPHVEVDGKHAFDFYETTTFTLDNGTKITVDTQAAPDNPNVFYSEKLTITRGDQAVVVEGLSELEKGDLSITLGGDAEALDAAQHDGFVLEENATGAGWRSSYTGEVATQKDLDHTKPGSTFQTLSDVGQLFNAFLGGSGDFFGALASLEATTPAERAPSAREVFRPMPWLMG